MPKSTPTTVGVYRSEAVHPSPAVGLRAGQVAYAIGSVQAAGAASRTPLGRSSANIVAPAATPPAVTVNHRSSVKLRHS